MQDPRMLDAFLDELARLPVSVQYAVLALLASLENVFPPVPADVAVALGAFLSTRGAVSAPLLGVLCWAANLASAAGVYFFARRHGPAAFESGPLSRLMPPGSREVIGRACDRYGALGVFFSRFLPGFRAAVPPFAGLVGMSPVRALVPAATASAVWYAFLIAVGSALGLSWERVRALLEGANRGLSLVALAVGLGLGIAAWRWWRRGLR